MNGVKIEFKDIPGFKEEIFAPTLMETRPAVLLTLVDIYLGNNISFLPNWGNQCTDLIVNDWFGKQYRTKKYYRWLERAAQPILSKNYRPKEKVSRLFRFLHDQLSWDGTYGLFPSHAIGEMENQRVVNKSSMNMALLAMLNAARIKAYPVLLATTNMPPVVKEINDVNQFNHFIIVVDLNGEPLYLDAGDPNMPIGYIDPLLYREPVILLRNYNFNWVEIPPMDGKSTILTELTLKRRFFRYWHHKLFV